MQVCNIKYVSNKYNKHHITTTKRQLRIEPIEGAAVLLAHGASACRLWGAEVC